jgi:hypothetical protein
VKERTRNVMLRFTPAEFECLARAHAASSVEFYGRLSLAAWLRRTLLNLDNGTVCVEKSAPKAAKARKKKARGAGGPTAPQVKGR